WSRRCRGREVFWPTLVGGAVHHLVLGRIAVLDCYPIDTHIEQVQKRHCVHRTPQCLSGSVSRRELHEHTGGRLSHHCAWSSIGQKLSASANGIQNQPKAEIESEQALNRIPKD